ncbi:MAG: mandelate racemase/muconate lactonizing enzyme family protein [Chloroflexi bacterium]|nr:mandelate racemase/muconate lactonizing enzyme family protein [Chloroflexota bacterium]
MWIENVQTYLVNANILQRADRPRGRNWLFIKMSTYEGIDGIGEASGWPEVVQKGIEELAGALYREEPFHTERNWQKLYRSLNTHGATGVVRGGILSALDMAMWDIKGKKLEVPIYDLLGGPITGRIRICGHADTVKEARALVERGYTAFKCKPDVPLLTELRAALGPEIDIAVHCQGQFTPSEALSLAEDLRPIRPVFLEDPTDPADLNALRWLGERARVPLAAGETLFSKWGFRDLIETRAISVAQPDITRIGGITEAKKIAALCEAHGVMLAPHESATGPIGEMAALHVLATTPACLFVEHRARDVFWRRDVVTGMPTDKEGHITVPAKPGLGLELNEVEIAKYPVKPYIDFNYEYEDEIAMNRRRRGTD